MFMLPGGERRLPGGFRSTAPAETSVRMVGIWIILKLIVTVPKNK